MDARAKPNQLNQPKYKKKEIKYSGIYSRSLITSSITLPITSIGKNIQETIEKTISNKFFSDLTSIEINEEKFLDSKFLLQKIQ